MDLLERARRYLAKCPPAISGQAGHSTCYTVAVSLVNGFALSEADALTLLREYNQTCVPPWSEKEMAHKVQQAATKPHAKPRGHLAGLDQKTERSYSSTMKNSAPISNGNGSPSLRAPPVEVSDALELPEAIPDATCALLRACFQPDEGVNIVPAALDEKGKELPDGDGPTLTRDEWLQKLGKVAGNPNRIWSQKTKAGIYIRVNPMAIGERSNDAAVTAFRHTLIEFDSMPIEQQWALYQQTRLPCSAVIYSGGRSLHAWVRVEARDRAEYDERVKFLHEYFSGHKLDSQNKNPSRLSRLPGCVRFDKRQELWSLGAGAASWAEWRVEIDLAGELMPLSWADLSLPVSMEDNLLGDRFLERGQGLILYGPAGCGKSVAALQAQVEWAAGERGLHIKPQRPLRIVVLQTEDSVNDLRESLAGILDPLPEDVRALVRKNLVLLPAVPGGDEAALARLMDRVAVTHKPDMISVNPLLAFCSADPTKNLGTLLYQHVDPVIKRHKVGFLAVHHTPKTNRMDTKGYGAFDHQYLAAGDARVANWPRAMIQIEPIAGNYYLFRVSKRSGRSGWTWDQKPTSERYFKHHKPIRWVDATPEDAQNARAQAINEDYRTLVDILPKTPVTRDRITETAKNKLNIGKHKAEQWLNLCIEDGLIVRSESRSDNNRKIVVFQRAAAPPTVQPT